MTNGTMPRTSFVGWAKPDDTVDWKQDWSGLKMKRLDGIENDKVSLEIGECDCGYHFGVDATFLDQVVDSDFTFNCPSCGKEIETAELFSEGVLPESPRNRTFAVYVMDKRYIKYVVVADSSEDAEHRVELGLGANEEICGKTLDGSEWYIDRVEEL